MAKSQFSASPRPLTAKIDSKGPYIATKLLCKEAISSTSKLIISIVTESVIDDNVLGKPISIDVKYKDESRQFHGLVLSIEQTEYSQEKELYYFQIEACDPLSLLAYRTNTQIFQNLTTKRVIETLLEDADFKSYVKLSVSGSGQELEYCTQMNESDLAFMRRLMSMEGWHYRLDHTGSKPVVIISDSNQGFESTDKSTFYYRDGSIEPERVIVQWHHKNQIGTAKISIADHTQALAEVFESDERKSTATGNLTSLTSYQFGQGLNEKSVLRNSAKLQMEALDVERLSSRVVSRIAVLSCGSKFKLAKHPISETNQEYVVTQITHKFEHSETGSQIQYQNQFKCIPHSVTYRPAYISKPTVQGIHSATVTGPNGDEVYTDKAGQIKVQFHWDKTGTNDENTSCWLPVTQGFASKGFGMQFLPRIGDEVLVQYIDGNPDRPVVVGSIYNKTNEAPYSEATQCGIKTRTTPNGSSEKGNELRFEDQEDKEEVYLRAEKDLLLEVNNDSTTTITGLQVTTVEKTLDMSSKENLTLKTEKDLLANSKGTLTASADKDTIIEAGSNAEITAKSSIKVDGQEVSISGKSKIELKVGACTLEISASGIKLDAPQIEISGKAKAEMKAAMVTIEGQGKTDVKGAMVTIEGSAMTQVKAGAMVQVKGGIAMVN
ncbi:type VI secretion system tip protein VgrG [Parashewanella spongiae]|uniref:Type VI secretion system tip protein VgrG n=1 Tax=Parashewanella spongiae TaxID=342950 RepID=A0A3A6TLH5_9GAMM|nr:type VI secretion system tip protein TssI/VgrG [Parashewanella spongiae]MCL1078182.1 type VI secretion system tip protein VgrG [Parashewanella spongiae]RJY14884.1 type VI secretion system tip protein VgrG [Parashewanella spongiae]